MKFEFRYWLKDMARAKYEHLSEKGVRCNMASDGKGVICFL